MSNEHTQGKERVPFGKCPLACPVLMRSSAAVCLSTPSTLLLVPPDAERPRWCINSCSRTPLREQPALYFTVLGEPAVKMLRYQQQFSFFDQSKLDGAIRFVNLSQVVLEKDLGAVLEEIVKEVEAHDARIVVWTRFALWCAKRRAARPKWNFRDSSSAWRCT